MKKIALDLAHLRVESFETVAAERAERGTVHGHWSQMGTCDGRVATCQYNGTCGPGCYTQKCTVYPCL